MSVRREVDEFGTVTLIVESSPHWTRIGAHLTCGCGKEFGPGDTVWSTEKGLYCNQECGERDERQ